MLTVWQAAQKAIVKSLNFTLEVFDQQILQFIIAVRCITHDSYAISVVPPFNRL